MAAIRKVDHRLTRLVSPEMAATAAIAGHFVDVRRARHD
jgi:homoaconitase/3-isopropylmalate dehydratase large subunit